MTRIHVLDDTTINKIAAGEVVERPASVVKELVENAIDAGATAIEIEIRGGGTSFIRVTDNGRGMERPDAETAILRHATSKISTVADLQTVGTLGFRGEALPTIASVSRFSLITRTADADLGTRVEILGGKTTEIEDAGCDVGTTVRVEDLFFNTPARKKFLKMDRTEAGKISDYVIMLALSRPDIAFRFVNNNRLTLMTAGDDSLRRAIESTHPARFYGRDGGHPHHGLYLETLHDPQQPRVADLHRQWAHDPKPRDRQGNRQRIPCPRAEDGLPACRAAHRGAAAHD